MTVAELKATIEEKLKQYERIANADRRLRMCNEANGRCDAYRELLKIIENDMNCGGEECEKLKFF